MCWCKDTGKSTKYLYILSDNNCLCKHQVSYELIVIKINLKKKEEEEVNFNNFLE